MSALDSVRAIVEDVRASVQFLSRLPFGSGVGLGPAERRTDALRFAPLVGVAVAAIQAATMAALLALRVPGPPAAGVGLCVSVWLTGALHEDGLADVADGFGGGATRDRKLAIMRDSRIGTFGAAALCCTLLVRFACLSALVAHGIGAIVTALFIAAPMSRALMLIPIALLPPARPDGLGHAVRAGAPWSLVCALCVALAIAAGVALVAPLSAVVLAATLAAATAASLVSTGLASRQIGGMTGDVAGATQQVAELAALLVLAAG